MKYKFKAFGLNIESEFPFQGTEIPEKGFFDVQVIQKKLPKNLKTIKHSGVNFESNSSEYLLKIPFVANYLIQNGNSIYIDPLNDSEQRDIELFFLGSAMAALLMQRNILPFHGSAFEKDGKATIITGKSGAGKTSLLNFFLKKGYNAITDDVSALTIQNDKVLITPSYPSSKIWSDVMQAFGYQENSADQVRSEINKYRFSVDHQFATDPLLVEKVYILDSKNSKTFSCAKINGFEKFKQLKNNIYRPKYPNAMGKEKETFEILQLLAQQTEVHQLTRSNSMKLFQEFNEFAFQRIIN